MRCLRLKKRKEFTIAIRSGKRVHASNLTVVYLPSKEMKMAVCVGKKYGNAVTRNRIKRLLREAFRLHAQKINLPYTFLLIPKVGKEYSVTAFGRDIEKILVREKLVET